MTDETLGVCDLANGWGIVVHVGAHPYKAYCVNWRPVEASEPLGVCDRNKDTLKQPHVRHPHCKNWRPVEANETLVVCDKLAEPHDCFKVHDCVNPRPAEAERRE